MKSTETQSERTSPNLLENLIIDDKEFIINEIIQSNKITMSRHSFSVMEKRAIYLIALQLRQSTENDTHFDKNLFGDILIRFSPSQVLKASDRYEHIYDALRKLRDKTFEINVDGNWEYFGIVERPKHVKNNNNNYFEFFVPKPIVEFFTLQIKKGNYTAFSAQVAVTLKRISSQRLYEMCSQYKGMGGFYEKIDDFRIKMSIDSQERYTRWANIEKDFIKPAYEELKDLYNKNLCDLCFNYSQVKEGRSTKGIKIKIISRNVEKNEELKIEDYHYYCKLWLNEMFQVKEKKKNAEFVSKIINEMNLNSSQYEELYNKLIRIKKNYSQEDQPKVVRSMIKRDFTINK